MKLDRPFIKLPFRFDAQRLAAEAEQFELADWRVHPQKYDGNSALRLITRDGGDNDEVRGDMKATELLLRCPYIQQIIKSFGVVVSRSRLMKLAPHSTVPGHCDTNYHWFNKVRIHIPITTNPQVLFYCDGEAIHMQAGDAWIFDNWRRHRVENNSDKERIHLVIDTVGSAQFWAMVRAVADLPESELTRQTKLLGYRYAENSILNTEVDSKTCIISPNELTYLCQDFHQDLDCPNGGPDTTRALTFFRLVITNLCEDWHDLYARHGQSPSAIPAFKALLERARDSLTSIPVNVVMRSNGVLAKNVFIARIVQGAVREPLPVSQHNAQSPKQRREFLGKAFERPIFIVSAPRSGSTLLFETLAKNEHLKSIGGESHGIFETIAGFNPAKGVVPDNQLTEAQLDDTTSVKILSAFRGMLQNSDGSPFVAKSTDKIRLLEKTPKNSLRIPFVNALFPDALFVYLYREPRENIASIIEAWLSGRWVTYARLPGRDKPWSLLLPPGWKQYAMAPVADVATFQWCAANDQIMTDLSQVDPSRVFCLSYRELVDSTPKTIFDLCQFAGVKLTSAFESYLAEPLPHSRYTLQAPATDKWKKHSAALEEVKPIFESTNERFVAWKAQYDSGKLGGA